MLSLVNVKQKLAEFKPRREPARRAGHRSAVTMILREENGEALILMIQRARREGDPWSGHMAFPGGRIDPDDDHSYAAAVRECEEEVGLPIDKAGRLIGRLSELPTHIRSGRSAMWVTPFVFELRRYPIRLTPNYEVADTIWVPLSFLADDANREQMLWQRGEEKLHLPCYYYQGKHIWGLSLGMLDELLSVIGVSDHHSLYGIN